MKLTLKDKAFLERLRRLVEEKDLRVDFRDGRLVLRQNYGARIESEFGMSRQGVRWRFQRLFSDVYVSAYETILLVESHFGTGLRQAAMGMAKQRWEARRKAQERGLEEESRRKAGPKG